MTDGFERHSRSAIRDGSSRMARPILLNRLATVPIVERLHIG